MHVILRTLAECAYNMNFFLLVIVGRKKEGREPREAREKGKTARDVCKTCVGYVWVVCGIHTLSKSDEMKREIICIVYYTTMYRHTILYSVVLFEKRLNEQVQMIVIFVSLNS